MRLVIICAAALAGCDAVAVGVRATPLGCRSAMRLVRVRACDTPAEEELPADAPPVVDDGDDVAADGADGLLSSPAFMKKKIEVLEDEISKLQLENANLEAKLEEETRTPQALRLQADFENFRRRTVEQQAEQVCAQRARGARADLRARQPDSRPRARSPRASACRSAC